MVCRILVPQPGIEPAHLLVEARSLKHWTTREVPAIYFYTTFITYYRGRQSFPQPS